MNGGKRKRGSMIEVNKNIYIVCTEYHWSDGKTIWYSTNLLCFEDAQIAYQQRLAAGHLTYILKATIH